MKILAFHGSPRRGGNSEILLEHALRAVRDSAHEVTLFTPSSMDIAPCKNCGGCNLTGVCTTKDEMSIVYEAIRKCDRVIISSPVFFLGLPSQMKKVIDRCQAFWVEKYVLNKPIQPKNSGRKGLFLVVGGMKSEAGYRCAWETVKAFFKTVSINEFEFLPFPGFDEKGAIEKSLVSLESAFMAGRRLIE